MHRHLLGLKSPPEDYIPDRFVMASTLPEDWDGDIWVQASGARYFLRAWNARSGRVAYGEGLRFEDARQSLLSEVVAGTRQVKISIHESKPA